MNIRPLAAADAQAYRRLMLHAYTQAPDAFTSTPEERAAQPTSWWVHRIADPQGMGLALGAFDNGELVGTAALEFNAKPKTRHKALLIGMFVEEAARGRGFGRLLVQALIAQARARGGLALLTLTATEGNAPAIGLYESCGFKAFGVEPMAILTPDGYKNKVHMALAISALRT